MVIDKLLTDVSQKKCVPQLNWLLLSLVIRFSSLEHRRCQSSKNIKSIALYLIHQVRIYLKFITGKRFANSNEKLIQPHDNRLFKTQGILIPLSKDLVSYEQRRATSSMHAPIFQIKPTIWGQLLYM